jgi:hypothetical protein
LNEEEDIRAEIGRLKEYKETIWNDSSDRTVYEWPVTSTKLGGTTVLKTSVWTNTVNNYISQKMGEIDPCKALEIGALKWCKEHIPRNGNDLTEEGQILLEDTRGECLNQLYTVSRQISGETRSPTTRNQTNVISTKRCGYHKEDSPQRELFQSKL